jgi:glycosyltransferase involved in cell wall biosynthesis
MVTSPETSAPPAAAHRKLRVLFLATRDWYNPETTGGDNTMWENARYLASVGHDVTFVCAAFRGAASRETRDGIEIVRLDGVHTLWLTTFVRYVTRWRRRVDVVVAEGFGGSRVPRLAALYVKEPLITEWHQVHRALFAIQYPRALRPALNALERVAARVNRSTFVRAGTAEWAAAFARLGFRGDRIFVLPVSVRDDWLAPPPAPPATSPSILWLGKLRRYKCPDHAIRALPKVLERVPGAVLTIAGRSDDRRYARELEALAPELGVADQVRFRWDVSEAEKRELVEASRVLVVTSAVEGFGIVVLEANACGVPAVASTGVPEGAVADGRNGLRYPFGDVDALAAALARLLTDPDLHDRLSAQARDFARRFAWSDVGARFEEVVQRCAKADAPAR